MEVFSTTLRDKQAMLLEVQKKIADPTTEAELCTAFLDGLLKPEFTAVATYLKMKPTSTMIYDAIAIYF